MSLSSKKIAKERIKYLFELADKVNNIDLAQKYIKRAIKISTRNRVSIPDRYKKRLCSNCNSFLIYGENCRVRIQNNNYITIKCKECGEYTRRPY